MRAALASLALLLPGCTSSSGTELTAPTPVEGSCNAAPAQSLVGEPASQELAARAQGLSGAAVVRWLQPGQIVTMEYRADRLTIVLDEQNRVAAIRCG